MQLEKEINLMVYGKETDTNKCTLPWLLLPTSLSISSLLSLCVALYLSLKSLAWNI